MKKAHQEYVLVGFFFISNQGLERQQGLFSFGS